MTWCSSQCEESIEEDYWSVNVAPPVCQLSVHLAAGPAPRPEHFPTGDLPLLPKKTTIADTCPRLGLGFRVFGLGILIGSRVKITVKGYGSFWG